MLYNLQKSVYCTYQILGKITDQVIMKKHVSPATTHFSKSHKVYFCHQFLCAHNASSINRRVQILTVNKTYIHGNFLSLRVGWIGVDTGEGFW